MRPLLIIALLSLAISAQTAELESLDALLIHATFKVANPKSTATVFVLTRQAVTAPDAPPKTQYILVTALHVFEKSEGDESTLWLRKKEKRDGDDFYSKWTMKLKIRNSGKPLWIKHPTADIAVMPFTPPEGVSIPNLSIDLLADDAALKKYDIHPGDNIRCAGFPHPNNFTPGDAWFPIVRQGCIAGFPLTPTKKTKLFLCDFNTFEGSSGGPVYLSETNRYYAGENHPGRTQLILGLHSNQHFLNETFQQSYESMTFRQRLGLGGIVHASLIRETIDLIAKDADPQKIAPVEVKPDTKPAETKPDTKPTETKPATKPEPGI